jgi:hypothetical protein
MNCIQTYSCSRVHGSTPDLGERAGGVIGHRGAVGQIFPWRASSAATFEDVVIERPASSRRAGASAIAEGGQRNKRGWAWPLEARTRLADAGRSRLFPHRRRPRAPGRSRTRGAERPRIPGVAHGGRDAGDADVDAVRAHGWPRSEPERCTPLPQEDGSLEYTSEGSPILRTTGAEPLRLRDPHREPPLRTPRKRILNVAWERLPDRRPEAIARRREGRSRAKRRRAGCPAASSVWSSRRVDRGRHTAFPGRPGRTRGCASRA